MYKGNEHGNLVFQDTDFSFFRPYTQNAIAGSYGSSIFNFLRNLYTIFPLCIPSSARWSLTKLMASWTSRCRQRWYYIEPTTQQNLALQLAERIWSAWWKTMSGIWPQAWWILMVTTAETRKMATAKTRATCTRMATASSNLWQPTDEAASVYNAVDHSIFKSSCTQQLKVYLELLPFLLGYISPEMISLFTNHILNFLPCDSHKAQDTGMAWTYPWLQRAFCSLTFDKL